MQPGRRRPQTGHCLSALQRSSCAWSKKPHSSNHEHEFLSSFLFTELVQPVQNYVDKGRRVESCSLLDLQPSCPG